MKRMDKEKSVARNMADIGGHRIGNFTNTSPTTAIAHCKRCGAEARIDLNPPSFPVTFVREGDMFSGMSCEKRIKWRARR